jgi:hypothetical protein
MPQYNPETNQYEETPEERKKREEQSQPGFFDKLGTALQTAGSNFVTNVQNAPENFVNNIKQGFDNVTNAPTNFSNNVGNMVSGPVRPPVATTSPVQTPNIKTTEERIQQQPQFTPDYSLANQQNGPGMRYGQAFAPQEQPAQPAMPVQPVQPQPLQPRVMPQQGQPIDNQQYNARVESGNNPNIGYHYPADQNGQRKSSAYGTYGITAPAYQDIQRTNPYFVNKPITSLTPEEQTQAYQTFTDLNKQQLQRVGVEPTDANLRLAHFLGANGAANYLKNGQISPQAARANGGMERVQQLAQQKLAGVQAPTSGASLIQQPAQQPQPVVEQPTPVQLGINAYQAIQNDPNSLIKLGFNENQPEFIRNRAKDRALELYSQDKSLKQAEIDLKNKTPAQLATVMQGRDKSSLGDWMQYLLFKHVGLNDLANEKGDQLGIGHQWQSAIGPNGENSLIKTSATGKPIEGYDANTGNQLTSQQLMQAMTNIGGKNKPDVSLQDVEATVNGQKIKGRVVTTFNAQNQPVTRVESGGKYYNYTGDWQPVSISTAAAKSETTLVNGLRRTFGNDVLKAEAQMIQDAGNFGSASNPMTREQFRALYMTGSTVPTVPQPNMPVGNQPQAQAQAPTVPQAQNAPQAQAQVAPPAQNMPQPAQAQMQQAPVRQAGEPVTAFKERLKDWNQQQDLIRSGQKETLKKASDVIADSANIVTNLTNIERAANDALTKRNNFGTIISGMIPGEQTVGEFFKTQDHVNTMNVLEQVNKVAAQNAKMLGTNPTDRDLQFVTSTKPDISWSQEAVADWLRKSADAQRRTLDFARKQVQSGGTYIPETPQSSAPGTKENPIKLQ